MNGQTLLDYYTTQRDLIVGLQTEVEQASPEAIHKWRVGVKKLRALWLFLQELWSKHPDFSSDMPAISLFYKQLGKVRDLQVQQQLLSFFEEQQREEYPRFRRYLEEREAKAAIRLPKLMQQFTPTLFEEADASIQASVQHIDWKHLDKNLQKIGTQRLKRLRKLYQHHRDIERLHDFRKFFKESLYVLKLAEGFDAGFHPPLAVHEMDSFAEELGHWHDRVVMLYWITRYRRLRPGRKSKGLALQVRSEVGAFMDHFESALRVANLHALLPKAERSQEFTQYEE